MPFFCQILSVIANADSSHIRNDGRPFLVKKEEAKCFRKEYFMRQAEIILRKGT